MNTLDSTDYPILIFVRGLPGSGKTYLARALQKRIGQQNVVMLDPDATDYTSKEYIEHTRALSKEGVDQKLHAYRFLRAQAYDALASHGIVIWNQPFTNLEIFNKMVTNICIKAAEYNTEPLIVVVEVILDAKIAKRRVEKRKRLGGHGPSGATFARFVGDYHSFGQHGYDVVTVRGDADVEASISAIIETVRQLQAKKQKPKFQAIT